MSNAKDKTTAQQRYRRVEVKMDVRISTIDPETDPETGRPYFRTSEEVVGNISRGGACVEADEAVAEGRRLLVEMDLPSGRTVQTVGRVAWTRSALADSEEGRGQARETMGIEFLPGTEEELGDLAEVFPGESDEESATSGNSDASAPAFSVDGSSRSA